MGINIIDKRPGRYLVLAIIMATVLLGYQEAGAQDAASWFHRGLELAESGNYEEAIECVDKSLEIDPKHAGAWRFKGMTLIRLGKAPEALQCFNKALEIDPKHHPNVVYVWSLKGILLDKMGMAPTEVLFCYDKALEIDPNHVPTWSRGVPLVEAPEYKRVKTAVEEKDVSRQQDTQPQDALTWAQRGARFGKSGNYEKAVECFDKALEIAPNNPISPFCWIGKGVALTSLGRPSEGIQWVNKGVEADPNSPMFLVAEGWTLTELGRHKEAMECYNKSLEIGPSAEAWSGKGFLLDKMGMTPVEVLFCYEKALEMSPRHPPIWSKKQEPLVETPEYKKVKAAVDG